MSQPSWIEMSAPPKKVLSEQEQAIVDMHKKNIPMENPKSKREFGGITVPEDSTKLSVDFVDEPIQDVLRAIATGYKLNLIPDKDIGELKITIHLEGIPVLEGLRQICRTHGMEVLEEGNLLRVRRAQEASYSSIDTGQGKLNINVRNISLREFLRDFSEKTKMNIVASQQLQGVINGQLKAIEPLDGLKAILAANGFDIRLKNGVYLVDKTDTTSSSTPGRSGFLGATPASRTSLGGDINVQNEKVTLSLVNSSLSDALRTIAEEAGLNFVIIGEVQGSVTAHLRDVSIDKAINTLLLGTRFAFIRTENAVFIGDRSINTSSGAALSSTELMYLKYIKVENIDKIFPKTINQENVKVIREQNAVLITGSGEEIEQVRSFLEKVDLPTPQVLLEILVVEYNRQQDSELGIGSGITDNAGANFNAFGSMSGMESQWTKGGWKGVIGFLPPKFDLSLRAMEMKNKAKVLAMPKVTTLNGNKAQLKVAKTNYFQVNSFSKDGLQNTDYRSFDDGINIELTPWVTQHGEVNVQIIPSIKTAEPPKGDSPAPITDRSISTNVTLKDGQTIALGGLIQSQEGNSRSFVPILGSIPVLGYLFSYRKLVKFNSELVIYVTPHILNPSTQGIELDNELSAIERRSGFVKTKDFLNSKEKGTEKRSSDSPIPPERWHRVPAPNP